MAGKSTYIRQVALLTLLAQPGQHADHAQSVEQQRQPFGVIQILGSVLRLQVDEGVGHAVELQRSQLVDGGMRQHCVYSPQWK